MQRMCAAVGNCNPHEKHTAMNALYDGGPGDAKSSKEAQTKRVVLRDLLQDQKEIVIVHNGEDYRLRITSNGKLILTK